MDFLIDLLVALLLGGLFYWVTLKMFKDETPAVVVCVLVVLVALFDHVGSKLIN